MESSRKRRGFIKGKLVGLPFYKTTKPVPFNNMTTSNQHVSKPTSKVGFVVNQHSSKSHVVPKKTQDPYSQFDKVFAYPGDEGIDLKAANYISSVLERFKLEQ